MCSIEQLSPLSSISLSVFYLQSLLINRSLFTCALNILLPNSSIFKRKQQLNKKLVFLSSVMTFVLILPQNISANLSCNWTDSVFVRKTLIVHTCGVKLYLGIKSEPC